MSELHESEMYDDICKRLDAKYRGCGNYYEVALHYGEEDHTIKSCYETNRAGPSAILFEVLSAKYPDLTVREFINVLEEKRVKLDTIRKFKEFDVGPG